MRHYSSHPIMKSRSASTRAFKLTAMALGLMMARGVYANPAGAEVIHGAANFDRSGSALTVTNTPGTIINWQQFSIAPDEITRFVQGSASSQVLNRVIGGEASSILGQLQSNGGVLLINHNGIAIDNGARIDTAGFIASSLQLSDDDFLSGRYLFTSGEDAGSVSNAGLIQAVGGSIFLIAPDIENSGLLTAPDGQIVLAAGHTVELVGADSPHVSVALTAPVDRNLNVSAATASGNAFGSIRNSGRIEASGVMRDAGGRILLIADGDLTQTSTGQVAADGALGGNVELQSQQGTVLAEGGISARGASDTGGKVTLTGARVGLVGDAAVDVSGATGGGTVRIGGGWHGQDGSVSNAQRLYMSKAASIRADALDSGHGGDVVLWSDEITRFNGSISAQGGQLSGDGGKVEVSGKDSLEFRGTVSVAAPVGAGGLVLLDPTNINIVAGPGDLDGELNSPADSQILFADGTGNSTLSASELEAFTSGTILLQASNSISVDTAVSLQSGVNLTLTANDSIFLNSNLTVTGTTTFNAATIQQNGAGLSVGMATFNGLYNFFGSLSISSGSTLTLNGGMNWARFSSIGGGGSLLLPSGQGMTLTGDDGQDNRHFLVGGTTLLNRGTITWANVSDNTLDVSGGSTLDNRGSLHFNPRDRSAFLRGNNGDSTTNSFLNSGIVGIGVNNNNGSVTVSDFQVFTNTGATFDSGPSDGSINITSNGSYSGTTTLIGDQVFFTAGTMAVSGTLRAASGNPLNIAGATMDLGDGSVLDLADNLNFTGGAINLTGATTGTTIASGSTLTLLNQFFGGSGKLTNQSTFKLGGATVSSAFINAGILQITGGDATFSNGMTQQAGSITVDAGRTLNVESPGLDWIGGALGAGAGTYDLSSLNFVGTGDRIIDGLSLILASLTAPGGSLELRSGSLAVSGTTTIGAGNTFSHTGGTLSLAGVTNAGTFTESSGATVGLTSVTTSGTFNISSGMVNVANTLTQTAGNVAVSGGSLAVSGLTAISSGATFSHIGGGLSLAGVTNAGTFTENSMGGVTLVSMANSGNFNIISGAVSLSGGMTQAAGTTTIASGRTLTIAGTPLVMSGGLLNGAGTVAGDVTNNGGTVSPGTSPGVLTINGNYVQGPGGTLLIELAGLTPGTQYDQLIVTGNASLDGTLTLLNLNSFTPAAGNSFNVLNAGTNTGATKFATAPANPESQYSGGNLSLVVPASITSPPDETERKAVFVSERDLIVATLSVNEASAAEEEEKEEQAEELAEKLEETGQNPDAVLECR